MKGGISTIFSEKSSLNISNNVSDGNFKIFKTYKHIAQINEEMFLPYNLFELISSHAKENLYLMRVHAIQCDQAGHRLLT